MTSKKTFLLPFIFTFTYMVKTRRKKNSKNYENLPAKIKKINEDSPSSFVEPLAPLKAP